MKKGEELLCKKDFIDKYGEYYFYKNKSYYINYIGTDDSITMTYDVGSVFNFTFDKDDLYCYLYNYFYSPEEYNILLRKKKLNSL